MPYTSGARLSGGMILLILPVLLAAQGAPQDTPRWRIPPGSLATSTIMWHLDSACTAGALAACDTIAMHHYATRDKGERKTAAELWQQACTAGGAGACANLALAYDDGAGVKQDRRKAFALAQQACDSGSAPGCVGAASMLTDGRAGKKDPARGTAFMTQACSIGDLYGCLNMGYRTLDGLYGVARDSNQARTYVARACAVAVKDHPYPWYRRTAAEACDLVRTLGVAN